MIDQILLCTYYDYYGELLTEKQQQYFKDYYFDNLTLTEMSENYSVSRNAIHKALKEVCEKLYFYEEKLKLVMKRNQIEELISELDESLQEKIKELI